LCNPKKLSEGELERLTRSYTRAISEFIGPQKDVPAPDVYTNPQVMAWMADEFSRLKGRNRLGVVTGKPVEVGGSKGRLEATAQGGVYVMEEIARARKWDRAETKVVIQGFGNVGANAALLLGELNYKVIAVSDSKGGIVCEKGMNPAKALQCKVDSKFGIRSCTIEAARPKTTCKRITNEKLLEEPCDVLVLSALENQITKKNARRIKAKMIIELANGPIDPQADKILAERGIEVIPDILVNAGGIGRRNRR